MAEHDILALDSAGYPVRWIPPEAAAAYYAMGKICWEAGALTTYTVLRGGTNRLSGQRSVLRLASIVAIEGPCRRLPAGVSVFSVTRRMLFARDRCVCAYCGQVFPESALELEHVHPHSRGGATIWQNLVSACRPCNQRKGDRTPEQAGMPLLYVPYVPSRHEGFILANRQIRSDQMQFLMVGVPGHSRLWHAATR